MTFIYLASPYSHKNAKVRQKRFESVCKAAARLMSEGKIVFSPIAHSHPIEILGFDQIKSGEFWKNQDVPFLKLASELCVLMLPGWEESKGVAWEIELAIDRGITVTYLCEKRT